MNPHMKGRKLINYVPSFFLFLFLVALLSFNDTNLASTEKNRIRVLQEKKGLYSNSGVITEIQTLHQFEELMSIKKPVIVLYYASWCSHCRSFVKPFSGFVNRNIKKISRSMP